MCLAKHENGQAVEIGVVLPYYMVYLLWLRPLHTAQKHCPTIFHTATVRPKRSGPIIKESFINNIAMSLLRVLFIYIFFEKW